MNFLKSALCLALCTTTARAETLLSFTAEITDEALAEDAILLVHCLSDRTAHSWELNSETRGPLWLKMKEVGPAVEGIYHKEGKDLPFTLKPSNSDEICNQLEPASNPTPTLGLLKPDIKDPGPRGVTEIDPPSNSTGKPWLWAAAAGAAILAGAFFWRAHQPSFSKINMN
jgi:hypothetical protein